MEDVNAIHRIFKNLKYEMDNNGETMKKSL